MRHLISRGDKFATLNSSYEFITRCNKCLRRRWEAVKFDLCRVSYACIHDELIQAPEVRQERGRQPRSAMFGEETRVV